MIRDHAPSYESAKCGDSRQNSSTVKPFADVGVLAFIVPVNQLRCIRQNSGDSAQCHARGKPRDCRYEKLYVRTLHKQVANECQQRDCRARVYQD